MQRPYDGKLPLKDQVLRAAADEHRLREWPSGEMEDAVEMRARIVHMLTGIELMPEATLKALARLNQTWEIDTEQERTVFEALWSIAAHHAQGG